ncbi:MAG: hypothetical protein U0531_13980 [Dehalococcoidia bacterium]
MTCAGWPPARDLADRMLDLFWDDDVPGFYDTARDAEAPDRAPA